MLIILGRCCCLCINSGISSFIGFVICLLLCSLYMYCYVGQGSRTETLHVFLSFAEFVITYSLYTTPLYA